MKYFPTVLLGATALLSTVLPLRADPKCNDTAVLEVYSEAIKCREIVQCASDIISGTSQDLAKLSDKELHERSFRSIADGTPPIGKSLPYFEKFAQTVAQVISSSMIGWRDVFPTMRVSATPIDYDPGRRRYTCQGRFSFDSLLLSEAFRRYSVQSAANDPTIITLILAKVSENQDPMPIVNGIAKGIEMNLNRCFNMNRIFFLQPTTGTEFIVNLDKNTMIAGCSVP